MSCETCSFVNGELEDKCGGCGASLLALRCGRKLKAHASHEEAPAHKFSSTSEAVKDSVPDDPDMNNSLQEEKKSKYNDDDDEDMKEMTKKMMGMIGEIMTDMSAVSSGMKEATVKASEAVEVAKKT